MPRLILSMLAASLMAQAQAPLAFEVATIKPSSQGVIGSRMAGPGRLSLNGRTLLDLVRYAYSTDFGNANISGGSKWMNDPAERFDMEAQGSFTSTPAEIKRMLQALLAERFALKVHRETREVPGYGLVLARGDGKTGPNVVEVTGKPCAGPPAADANTARCGSRINPLRTQLLAGRMEHLADLLSNQVFQLGRPVVDRTGLAGEFDITLDFALLVQKPDGANAPADLLNGPSLATALREQLGLRLDSVRIETVTLVVDSAEKPGDN
jgi:uncharacterized protein (TIGR03435 family)